MGQPKDISRYPLKNNIANIKQIRNVNSNEMQLKEMVKYNQTLKNNKMGSEWQDGADRKSHIYLLAAAKARTTPQAPS